MKYPIPVCKKCGKYDPILMIRSDYLPFKGKRMTTRKLIIEKIMRRLGIKKMCRCGLLLRNRDIEVLYQMTNEEMKI